jgi:hypothetical protein
MSFTEEELKLVGEPIKEMYDFVPPYLHRYGHLGRMFRPFSPSRILHTPRRARMHRRYYKHLTPVYPLHRAMILPFIPPFHYTYNFFYVRDALGHIFLLDKVHKRLYAVDEDGYVVQYEHPVNTRYFPAFTIKPHANSAEALKHYNSPVTEEHLENIHENEDRFVRLEFDALSVF